MHSAINKIENFDQINLYLNLYFSDHYIFTTSGLKLIKFLTTGYPILNLTVHTLNLDFKDKSENFRILDYSKCFVKIFVDFKKILLKCFDPMLFYKMCTLILLTRLIMLNVQLWILTELRCKYTMRLILEISEQTKRLRESRLRTISNSSFSEKKF